jgi:hypothetical protein
MKTATEPRDSRADPPPFVAPTPDEIRHADELRRAIERRYLANSKPESDPYWSVGAD